MKKENVFQKRMSRIVLQRCLSEEDTRCSAEDLHGYGRPGGEYGVKVDVKRMHHQLLYHIIHPNVWRKDVRLSTSEKRDYL